jgi:hypothetical protein
MDRDKILMAEEVAAVACDLDLEARKNHLEGGKGKDPWVLK